MASTDPTLSYSGLVSTLNFDGAARLFVFDRPHKLSLLRIFLILFILFKKNLFKVRLWDIRSDQEVCQYKPPTPNSSFTSVGCSMSGRILLGSSDDSTVHMWDVAGAHCGSLSGHDNR